MKNYIGIDVLEAACRRISTIFDEFENIYLSFSGGKDSTVMLHLAMDEAIKRKRKIGVLCIDLEGQYKHTIDHIRSLYEKYSENIIPFWICLPIVLSNSVSVYEPRWIAWEPGREWIRKPDKISIIDQSFFQFYRYPMEFEEFAPEFGIWFAEGKKTACLVGIRADESLHRYATIKREDKSRYKNYGWTTKIEENVYNCYPIYDWQTADIWRYTGKFKREYNKIYDLMYKAGVSIHQQRLCQPYGVDQRKGLWLFHILEPETWSKIVSRVNGANSGAEFVQYSGNISGQIKITKPDGHTWQSFARLILKSMPEKLADHYDDKICQFISWWSIKGSYIDENGKINCIGYNGYIPDEVDRKLESSKTAPSWRRICKTLLRNDYWCKGLSFSQTDSHSYQRYKEMMRKRKNKLGYIPLWI